MQTASDIINKELEKVGYDMDDAWFIRGNIIRELKRSGFEIVRTK